MWLWEGVRDFKERVFGPSNEVPKALFVKHSGERETGCKTVDCRHLIRQNKHNVVTAVDKSPRRE